MQDRWGEYVRYVHAKTVCRYFGDDYEYADTADYAEYLYDPQSLMTYAGKKLHSKRNHVNNFIKAYTPNQEGGCVFRSYASQDKDKVFAFINGWEESKGV